MQPAGFGSMPPISLIDLFERVLSRAKDLPALSQKINNKWDTYTFQQYYDQSTGFAAACIRENLVKGAAVNIIAFNCREWNIAFMGSIFAGLLPVGVYTTNSPEACQYVAENSDCSLVVVENNEQLEKYLAQLQNLPKLKKIVVIKDSPN